MKPKCWGRAQYILCHYPYGKNMNFMFLTWSYGKLIWQHVKATCDNMKLHICNISTCDTIKLHLTTFESFSHVKVKIWFSHVKLQFTCVVKTCYSHKWKVVLTCELCIEYMWTNGFTCEQLSSHVSLLFSKVKISAQHVNSYFMCIYDFKCENMIFTCETANKIKLYVITWSVPEPHAFKCYKC